MTEPLNIVKSTGAPLRGDPARWPKKSQEAFLKWREGVSQGSQEDVVIEPTSGMPAMSGNKKDLQWYWGLGENKEEHPRYDQNIFIVAQGLNTLNRKLVAATGTRNGPWGFFGREQLDTKVTLERVTIVMLTEIRLYKPNIDLMVLELARIPAFAKAIGLKPHEDIFESEESWREYHEILTERVRLALGK